MGQWFGGLLILALIVIVVPNGTLASDCATSINVYGRSALAPGVLPPPSPVGPVCAEIQSSDSSGHKIPPLSDQIMVRLEKDIGPSYPELRLRLDGLGWRDQQFTLVRTQSLTGPWMYTLDDWIGIPDANVADPTLHVKVRFPGDHDTTVDFSLVRTGDLA